MSISAKSVSPSVYVYSSPAPYIVNRGADQSIRPYPPVTGEVRWNLTQSSMEVYDGAGWRQLTQDVLVGLSEDAEKCVSWARSQHEEQQNISKLAEKYPIIAELRDQLKAAIALVKEHESK